MRTRPNGLGENKYGIAGDTRDTRVPDSAKRVFRFDWGGQPGTVKPCPPLSLVSNEGQVGTPASSSPPIPTDCDPIPSPQTHKVIPWPVTIDPLHTGRLEGRVPDGWTRDGWIMATKDRLRRLKERDDERTVTRMLQAELKAIEGG